MIHRDIKPANIILSRVGKRADVAKVVDFGLVKEVAAASDLTGENNIAGTPAYLAPEALTDPERVGPASDLYALGAVAFFLLTGERVFTAGTLAAVLAHHIHTEPPTPSSRGAVGVPPLLDEIVVRCLAKDPGDRYASAAALRDALECVEFASKWSQADATRWWDAFGARDQVALAPLPEGMANTIELGRLRAPAA